MLAFPPGHDLLAPHTGQSVGEGHGHTDEERRHQEQPEVGEALGEIGLAEVHQERAVHRTHQAHAPAHGGVDHHLDRGHDADEGRRHEAHLQREQRAANARQRGGQAEHEDLEAGHVVAGEAHAVFLVAHGQQQRAELALLDPQAQQHAAQQHGTAEVVQDVLGAVGADVPAQQGLQVGHAVDTAGVALLADDQHRQDQRHGLRDDGEVHAADTPLEHGVADDEGQQRGDGNDGDQRERQVLERLPPDGQGGELVPVHEVRDAGGGLDLGGDGVGRFQLEEHGHGVAAQAEEDALAQAQDAAIAPDHHQPEGDEAVGQVLAHQVEAEDVEGERKNHQQQHCQQGHAAQAPFVDPGREIVHGVTPLCCGPISGAPCWRTGLAGGSSGSPRSRTRSAPWPWSRS